MFVVGVDAEWLVTLPHEPDEPGRLLVYCTACRSRLGTVDMRYDTRRRTISASYCSHCTSYSRGRARIASRVADSSA